LVVGLIYILGVCSVWAAGGGESGTENVYFDFFNNFENTGIW